MVIVFPVGTQKPASATQYVTGNAATFSTLGPFPTTTVRGPSTVRYAELHQPGAVKAEGHY